MIVYHGSPNEFDKFDHEKIGSSNATSLGRGFYFTMDKIRAKGYGKHTRKFEITIKKPVNQECRTIDSENIVQLITACPREFSGVEDHADLSCMSYKSGAESACKIYDQYEHNDLDLINVIGHDMYRCHWEIFFKKLKEITGHDGIIHIYPDGKTLEFVVFNNEDIEYKCDIV